MNKILLIIVALIVIIGGFTFFANKTESPTTSTNQPVVSVQPETSENPDAMEAKDLISNVILSDAGFEPKDITVKAGTIVIWVNKSGKDATVSSDDHPTHKLYQFLNLGEFPNSSSVQVVFDKPGKYTYHDHLNASSTGTVTVE